MRRRTRLKPRISKTILDLYLEKKISHRVIWKQNISLSWENFLKYIWFSRYCNVEKYCFKQLVLTAFFISFETIFPSCLQDSYHCKNHRSTVDTCITFVVWYSNTVIDKAQNLFLYFSLHLESFCSL